MAEIVKNYQAVGPLGFGYASDGTSFLNFKGRPLSGTFSRNGQPVSGFTQDGSSAGGASAGGAAASSQAFLPGQSARFTPDPTVNGPWTHTRADIPLFRTPGSAPTGVPATGGMTQPGTPSAPAQPRPQNPAFQNHREAMRAWWKQRPRRMDRRSLLADALEGK